MLEGRPVDFSHGDVDAHGVDVARGDKFGAQGIGARAAVGVATLPGNAPVEIQLVAEV